MNTIRLKKVYWWPKETIYLSRLDQISDVQTIKHAEEYSSLATTTVLYFMIKRITSMHPRRSKSRSYQ